MEKITGIFIFAGMIKYMICNMRWLILFYFSDARSMASDVRNIILKVVMEKGQMTEQQAVAYLKKMETQKRYSADVWS